MDPLNSVAALVASWWGYAEGEPTIVGLLVLAIAALAVTYVVLRLRRTNSGGARQGDDRR